MPVLSWESRLQGQELIKCGAKRIDVAAVVYGSALRQRLLRTHVTQRADEVAADGQAEVGLAARQAEVRDPQMTTRVHQQIGRLDVAVDNALIVGVLQGLGSLNS